MKTISKPILPELIICCSPFR